jgi:hypothetical protein
VSGVEHSYAAGIKLEDQALFGVYSNAIADKFPTVENK